MKKHLFFSALFGVVAASAGSASAAVAMSGTNVGTTYGGGIIFTYSFVPTQNLTVSAMGMNNFNNNGSTFDVAILSGAWTGTGYSGSGTVVADALVAVGTDPVDASGYFDYHTLSSPVTLLQGTAYTLTYSVATNGTNPSSYDFGTGVDGDVVNPAFSSDIGFIANSGGIAFGSSGTSGVADIPTLSAYPNTQQWIGDAANFQYSVAGSGVPEPASMGLLVLGAAGLIVRRRRACSAK